MSWSRALRVASAALVLAACSDGDAPEPRDQALGDGFGWRLERDGEGRLVLAWASADFARAGVWLECRAGSGVVYVTARLADDALAGRVRGERWTASVVLRSEGAADTRPARVRAEDGWAAAEITLAADDPVLRAFAGSGVLGVDQQAYAARTPEDRDAVGWFASGCRAS